MKGNRRPAGRKVRRGIDDADYLNRRIRVTLIIAILGFSVIELRAFYIQVINNRNLSNKAEALHRKLITLYPRRGEIVDREGRILAITVKVPSIYINPREVRKKGAREKALRFLLSIGISRSSAIRMLESRYSFLWVKRYVSEKLADKVRRMNIPGIQILTEYKRTYPSGHLGGYWIGFAGVDTVGLEGLELKYNRILSGEPVKVEVEKDGLSRNIYVNIDRYLSGTHANSIVLTIDGEIQAELEEVLKETCRESDARLCMGIVTDPVKGEVLAGAVYPFFNPNNFRRSSPDQWRNRLVTDVIEPGSTFKVFLFAGALEEKLIADDELFYCEDGKYPYYNVTISDYKPFGYLTAEEVIIYSSNICAGKIATLMGTDLFYNYIRAFGFGEKTGIDFPGESDGILREPDEWTPVDLFIAGFGQGIGVTPVQLIAGFNAVINGGYLMRPYLVKAIKNSSGKVIKETEPFYKKRVISEDTSRKMREILYKVVEMGTGKKARIPGYMVGGKTGTAQKYDPSQGKYSDERYQALFMGMAPVDAPKISCLIIVDEPKNGIYGGEIAAPAFKKVMEFALRKMGVLPRVEVSLAGSDKK